jgi:NAD-dependent SIR2 family protein deacetylase
MPYRKNVFIVGAGFSAEAGAPVVRTFFEHAMELWKNPNSGLEQQERGIFREVFDYRHELETAESKVQIDLDNIEDLFGTVEMASQLGFNDAQTVKGKLIYVILRTLELTATGRPGTRSIEYGFRDGPNQRSSTFLGDLYEFFVNVVARRWEQPPKTGLAQDTIISLNYDLLLERAMDPGPLTPLYELSPEVLGDEPAEQSGKKRVRLLKLHGSANWAVCPTCRKRIYVLKCSEASVLGSSHAPVCGDCEGQTTSRLIVPPAWNKEEYRPLLNNVWKSAASEIATAQRLVVIGYSMPETDKFFQYLLALSLQKNRLLDQVVVVNNQREHGDKIAKLFKRHYERRKAILVSDTFERWVRNRQFLRQLGQVFSQAEPAW